MDICSTVIRLLEPRRWDCKHQPWHRFSVARMSSFAGRQNNAVVSCAKMVARHTQTYDASSEIADMPKHVPAVITGRVRRAVPKPCWRYETSDADGRLTARLPAESLTLMRAHMRQNRQAYSEETYRLSLETSIGLACADLFVEERTIYALH